MANMMGSFTNVSPVKFSDVRPLARLIGEYELVVVPASSDIKTLNDLVERLRKDPKAVSWGGGSPGSADHLLVAQIAKAAGVDPASVNYVGHSGGGEAMASILGGHVTVGVSGYGEFATFIKSGQLRALAISSEKRVEGVDIPTFIEQGINVQIVNWRGLFAAKDIADKDLAALSDMIGTMVKSASWKKTLSDRGWIDLYQSPEEFATFFAADSEKAQASLKEIGLVQ
jgi:putative tricarboxylic transport membrane protein